MKYAAVGFAVTTMFALGVTQAAPPTGPVAEIFDRLDSVERDVEALRQGGGKLVLVDSNGSAVGPVVASSPNTALVEMEFDGRIWQFVFNRSGPYDVDEYYRYRVYASEDCSGPAYFPASNFGDGLWGNKLRYEGSTNVYRVPRIGAVPADVRWQARTTGPLFVIPSPPAPTAGTTNCQQVDSTEPLVVLAFSEDDLVEIPSPSEGFVGPFRVVPAD